MEMQLLNLKNKRLKFLFFVFILVLVVIFLDFFSYFKLREEVEEASTENIVVTRGVVNLSSMTLRQKLAQMVVVRGDGLDPRFNNLGVGGIFLDRQPTGDVYQGLIEEYQEGAVIELFVATDLEGAWTPFHDPTEDEVFPFLSEIETAEEAYDVGLRHGELLAKIGFNVNFAPVAEYSDNTYGGRVFSGNSDEIKSKVVWYIEGLQENVIGTCKHYPGRSMERNLHHVSDRQEISKEDLELFDLCIEKGVGAIMVSHQIVNGVVDSDGRPASVSSEVIGELENFEGLIIADEINMAGLKNFYPDKTQQYVDLINAGNDIILDFDLSPVDLHRLLKDLEERVLSGAVSEREIDESVEKIFVSKSYGVIY